LRRRRNISSRGTSHLRKSRLRSGSPTSRTSLGPSPKVRAPALGHGCARAFEDMPDGRDRGAPVCVGQHSRGRAYPCDHLIRFAPGHHRRRVRRL
jgi:hypothetical protein